LQWFFWTAIQPYVWFLFYPAVFFSSWVGGLRGGLLATALSAGLVWYFFIPVPFSFALETPMALVSIAMFVGMGILFSIFHGRLRQANQQAAEALAALQSLNEQLEARLLERTTETAPPTAGQPKAFFRWIRDSLTLMLVRISRRGNLARLQDPFRMRFAGWASKLVRSVSTGRLWGVWSIVMVAAGALLRVLFLQGLGTNAPYITFYPSVVIAALYGGLRAGLLTLVLSAAVGIYFWVEPVHTFTFKNSVDWLLLATFLITTVLISFVTEAMHRARAAAQVASEREKAAQERREDEARLRLSVRSANIGFWDWDLKTNAVYFSPEWKNQIGYREDEISNRFEEWQSRLHPDDLDVTMHKVLAFIENPQGRHEVEFRMRHKDGSFRWIYAIADILRGADGMPERMLGCHLDITQRKRAEVEREKFLLLAENSSEFIGMCDLEMNPLYVNPAGRRMVGLPDMAAACRVKVQDYYFPEDQAFIKNEFFPRVLSEGQGEVEIRLRHFQTGEPIWMNYCLFHLRDASGAVVGWATVSRDITERRQAEKALLASEESYRMLFREMQNGFAHSEIICDAEGRPINSRYLVVNPAFERITGKKGEAVLGKTILEVFPALEPEWIETFGRVALTGEPARFEMATAELDITFDVAAFRPAPHQYACTFSDITARKRAEAALRAREQEFRSLAEAMPQIVWVTRPDGGNIYFNRQWVDYTGLTLEESYGNGWNKPFHPEDKQRAWDAWQRATQHHTTYSLECRLRRADGTYRWWLMRGVPYCNDQDEILKWFGTCTDIDDMRRAADEIRQLNQELEHRVRERTAQLEAATKELESFSYSVSHDLRSPLRHVQGFVGMLERELGDNLSERGRHLLKTVASSSHDMAVLIDDLLAFSRMSRQEMEETNVPLNGLVQEVQGRLDLEKAGRKIVWHIAALPTVRGDPAMLRQIFVNLLDNAVKYTRPRETAEIEVGSAGMEDGRAILFVRDNGVGFDPQFAHKLFGIFQRLHHSNEFEGTGIGLANVQRIVVRHGGRTWAASQPNQGAAFFFTLKPAQT
jgi:PAS domain S-box-containing protein